MGLWRRLSIEVTEQLPVTSISIIAMTYVITSNPDALGGKRFSKDIRGIRDPQTCFDRFWQQTLR